jgi:hypothetical protein
MNFVYNIYTYQSQGCHKLGERKRNRERRKRKREEKEERSKRGGERYPCTCREKLHFALPEKSLHLQREQFERRCECVRVRFFCGNLYD